MSFETKGPMTGNDLGGRPDATNTGIITFSDSSASSKGSITCEIKDSNGASLSKQTTPISNQASVVVFDWATDAAAICTAGGIAKDELEGGTFYITVSGKYGNGATTYTLSDLSGSGHGEYSVGLNSACTA